MSARSGGFVDLRVHHASAASHSDDSIWPSFTDIMMVVVIIFLMASVIFMLRNVQLGTDLERAASSRDEATATLESLRERAIYLTDIIEKTRKDLVLSEDQRARLEALSEERAGRIGELEYTTAALHETQVRLNSRIESLQLEIASYQDQVASLTSRIGSMNVTMSELETLISDKTAELEQLEQRAQSYEARAVALEEMRVENRQEIKRLIDQAGLKDEQIRSLAETAESQRSELSGQLAQLDELRAALVQQGSQIEQLTGQRSALQSALDTDAQAQARLRERLASAEQSELRLQSELDALHDAQSKSLARIAALSETERQNLLALGEQKEQMSSLQQRLSQSLEAADAMSARFRQRNAELESLRGQLTAAQVEKAALQAVNAEQLKLISSMDVQVAQRDQEIESLRAEQAALMEGRAGLESAELSLQREVEFLQQAQRDQEERVNRLLTLIEQLGDNVTRRDEKIERLETQRDTSEQDRRATLAELTQLKTAYQQRLGELAELQTAFEDQGSQAAQLRSQIVALEQENQLLLRPARSEVNRYVVSVSYSKDTAGNTILTYNLPDSSGPTAVSRAELERILESLKAEKSEGLYTRIVFPDEDGVKFSEAWEFTQDILSKYDYYYQ